MKKILFLSLVLNLLFLASTIIVIHRKGGMTYLKAKISPREKIIIDPLAKVKMYKYWIDKNSLFEILPKDTNEIVFIGNSLTDRCEWHELLNNPNIKNRGIDLDNTAGTLNRLGGIISSNPHAVFIEIGINDLEIGISTNMIINNYDSIFKFIKANSPNSKVFSQSIFPVSLDKSVSNDSILSLNKKLEHLCLKSNVIYIDLFSHFYINNQLNPQLTTDGAHLNGEGYLLWSSLLKPYLN